MKALMVAVGLVLISQGARPHDILALTADPAPVEIPDNSRREPLRFIFSISKNITRSFELAERNGKCYLDGIDLSLPAPCDVVTKTSAFGFALDNRYDPTTMEAPLPSNKTVFEILGGVKFYPVGRNFCGPQWQLVTLTWPKGSSRKQDSPYQVELTPMRGTEDRVRCTRSYHLTK